MTELQNIRLDLENFKEKHLFLKEEDKNVFWEQDGVHFSKPLTPLFASYMVPALTKGTEIAFEKLKLPMKQFKARLANGQFYQTVPMHDNPEERLEQHKQEVQRRFPKGMEILDDYVKNTLLPYYQQLDKYKNEAFTLQEAQEKVLELFEKYQEIWGIHFEVVMPRISLGMALEEMYGTALQTKNTSEVYDLLLGTMNKSLETDRELWKLSQTVKQSTILAKIFADNQADQLLSTLSELPEGKQFLEAVRSFLDVYGYRTAISHEFADETWIENPYHALKMIQNYLEKDYNFEAEFQKVIQKRERKVEEVLSKFPEGDLKEAFKGLHALGLKMWGLDEDHHFYIDAMLPAKSRLFLLNVGDLLVSHSVFQDKEDIAYLYLDELVEVLAEPKPVQQLIAERKEEHEENLRKPVAPFFGPPPEGPVDPVVERVFGTKMTELNKETKSFSGYGGSQGTYTGKVKVVKDQSEFGKVKKGEILVCKTTTPPWTVLFTLAGAIVTDRGGILSHAATVAREYEVPCVVGAKIATATLKDGDVITVDGTKGEIIIHEQH